VQVNARLIPVLSAFELYGTNNRFREFRLREIYSGYGLGGLYQVPHLDLDLIAWETDRLGVRAAHEKSLHQLMGFIAEADFWVIEGCYSELLKEAAAYCTEMIFLTDYSCGKHFLRIG
jgi:hypothetical protein